MVAILSLWLPILVSAVFVFVASSVIHMALKYHSTDFGRLPDEDAVMGALRPFDLAPGEYVFPYVGRDYSVTKSDAFQEKARQGPVGFVTVLEKDSFLDMGPQLVQWFLYCVAVSVVAAYVASRALPAGAEYLAVHRFAGVTAFAAYALGTWQRSIWFKQAWSTSLKNTVDGLIYALITGGTFGWLWPS